MGVRRKKVKFPFDLTKGLADDLYRLRFMRRSELEPNVRHNFRSNVNQLGHQLDIWFKEQLFTIGALNREQEKIFRSQKHLMTESRKSRRRQYEREKEIIREKLRELRTKSLCRKVLRKFRENVILRKIMRGEISPDHLRGPKGNVDFLRVSGNKHLVNGYRNTGTDGHDFVPDVNEQDQAHEAASGKHKSRGKLFKGKTSPLVTLYDPGDQGEDTSNEETRLSSCMHIASNKNDTEVKVKTNSRKGQYWNKSEYEQTKNDGNNVHDKDDDEDVEEEDTTTDEKGDHETLPEVQGLDQRLVSAHGPRMETIPEESDVEIEVDMEDERETKHLRKRVHLNQLNRSISKRNIFDVSDSVPLLPEVTGSQASFVHRPHPETFDKETQTSDKSSNRSGNKDSYRPEKGRCRRRHLTPSPQSSGRRKLVIKLPGSITREDSAKSNSGNFGSDEEDESGTDFAYGFESETWYESSSDSDDAASIHSDTEATDRRTRQLTPGDYSLTLTKYKTTLHRKAENSVSCKPTSHSFPTVTNISANLPAINYHFQVNPFSLKFKERSFYIKSSISDRPTHSAGGNTSRGSSRHSADETSASDRTFAEISKDLRHRQSESGRHSLDADQSKRSGVLMHEHPSIAVFGRKADSTARAELPPPPNTPNTHRAVPTPRRKPRTHLSQVLLAQKMEREREQERIHDIVTSEPVQKYERTKSGKIKPFGSPRVNMHEVPSLKEQYYRDKLLKQERENILKQNVKMKRFIDMFNKESFLTQSGLKLERGQSVILPSSRPMPIVRRLDILPSPTPTLDKHLAVCYSKFTHRTRIHGQSTEK
ncbi:uncharacterized protein LOC127878064 isoform X2 [Dreissena polymorpha]|uniref:Uncharacterized protein n=1 Tax=Dreissena polymorpha TaxID=45954 RepID=A0A9D4QT26_DREPO|nr:uncharacterized protein LOC127878064 isoform X2 [Dreissena polymorpha]KAH3842098.1 hypothetical protein DPMN_115586 [Dreissena polymorpha]